jgi:hypothetical protein
MSCRQFAWLLKVLLGQNGCWSMPVIILRTRCTVNRSDRLHVRRSAIRRQFYGKSARVKRAGTIHYLVLR